MLLELDELCEERGLEEPAWDAVEGVLPVLCGNAEVAPLILDAESVAPGDGEAAWIPAVVGKSADAETGWAVGPNLLSTVHVAHGDWDDNKGMLLAMNMAQPEVLLLRGDVVGLATRRPSDPRRPDLAHIVLDDEALSRMFAVELPPEEYFEALAADTRRRHPQACPHVLEHLMAVEVLLVVAVASGFSFGVAKARRLATECRVLGEIVGRHGRAATGEHVEAILRLKPVEDVSQLRSLLGLTNWVREHCPTEHVVPLKVLTRWLRKGAEWPMTEEGRRAERALKALVAKHVRLDAVDELAALSGERPLHQLADACRAGWGGTVYQVAVGGQRLNACAMFAGLMTDAQALWPILSQELFAQLQVARRRRRLMGRIPAECWTDHANVVRIAYKAEAEEKHIRWVADIESDGSRLRSLPGRSAALGDALSRLLVGADRPPLE